MSARRRADGNSAITSLLHHAPSVQLIIRRLAPNDCGAEGEEAIIDGLTVAGPNTAKAESVKRKSLLAAHQDPQKPPSLRRLLPTAGNRCGEVTEA